MPKKTNTKTAPKAKTKPQGEPRPDAEAEAEAVPEAEALPEELDAEEQSIEGDDVEADVEEIDVVEAAVDVADGDLAEDLEEETVATPESEAGPALDELETEELEMLTEDEESEVIQVDEVAEMRAIRREELALDKDAESVSTDEFVCQSCFLVKRTSQLAEKRRKICKDCAS